MMAISLSLPLFLSPPPPPHIYSPTPTVPSIAVTYRQPPELFNPSANRHLQPQQQPQSPGGSASSPRDKDRFHTLNRSIRALLNVRRGPRSPNTHHRTGANLEKDSVAVQSAKSPSFQSCLGVHHNTEEREREMDRERSSPRGSPQMQRRRTNAHRNEVGENFIEARFILYHQYKYQLSWCSSTLRVQA